MKDEKEADSSSGENLGMEDERGNRQEGEEKNDVNDNSFEDIIPANDYKRIYTSIINEKMLIEGIAKYGDVDQECVTHGNITDVFIRAKCLSLENRNILVIQNMNIFKNLEELCLDNNHIEELENLDELEKLRILSVSNNKIKKIKNLDKLINLRELNLHNNNINKIENLNKNIKLKILILSKNNIKNKECIIYLKCLKKLKILNLTDNPICYLQNSNCNYNVEKEILCQLKNVTYFNNKLLNNLYKEKEYIFCNVDNNIMNSIEIKKNSIFCNSFYNNEMEYDMKIVSDAYLSDVITLSNALFNEKNKPSVLLKFDCYDKIRENFVQDIHSINYKMINQVLSLNEQRKKCSDIFEQEMESFIAEYMQNNVHAFNQLRKRSKKVVRTLLRFLECGQDIGPIELKKCPEVYKKKAEMKESKTLSDEILKKVQNISKDISYINDNQNEIILQSQVEKREIQENSKNNFNFSMKNKNEKKDKRILISESKYNIIKKYIEKNIEDNFSFQHKLIKYELVNITSLNNFLENFKINIAKIIKIINDIIFEYFRNLEEFEDIFNSKILKFFSDVKNNEHPSIVLSEDEINEYYTYKGNRSNLLNNLEDFISSSYSKAGSYLIEEKKKHLFLKSRERISEIGKIVENFNDLFFSYLSILHVK
ncbi:leucine-rich repeat protein (LRR8) [Plasmodium ovale wallikeri]|uniref:Leucine-rich repeat protein (LRR8) n=2 Tax=Plasmodium ovale TaxID=36330 RepID=A0A1A8YQH7_PLAOA|nr:leucine-rich repeat protein (LRR8) [Plasmodium ovale wallikeri]SBT34205.1 leucine-rich repeat protein (LRR8) [Plasmodium ovale wallikeri]SBT76493.1 leucine-rich repeat protein [Plasmodium ovale]